MRKQYEGSGKTLDEALEGFEGDKTLGSFSRHKLHIEIFRRNPDATFGQRVAEITSRRSYERALQLAQGIAETNTKEKYNLNHYNFGMTVSVTGYYH